MKYIDCGLRWIVFMLFYLICTVPLILSIVGIYFFLEWGEGLQAWAEKPLRKNR